MPTALITGASAGIGKDFAKLYAAKGYDLVLVARRKVALEQLSEELKSAYGRTSHVVPADLGSSAAPQLIQDAVKAAGLSIDVLVNNAGYGFNGPFAEVPLETHADIIQVNISSLVQLTRIFLPSMLQKNSGGIMNVASTAAFVPGPMMAVYYATKAFVLSFTEALANEVGGSNVKVSCLCPGATTTEFQVRSGMDKTDIFKGVVMDSMTVAKMGVEGLAKNETVVICGLKNQIAVAAAHLVPRKISASMVRKLQDIRTPH